ncbi:MAG: ferrochelatase [Sulfurimonadaceae bacterium]|nr:ferrochelatase [Sulfurimonadaceae bacterium]
MKKDAVILLNMGGPNNLDEVELFLKNMFNDPNILTMKSSLLRKFVATMITFFRTESSQEIYRELGGKSPIVDLSKKLVAALQSELGDEVVVDFAMRYTPPFADEVCKRLEGEGVDKIYLIPLYPQYSTTTTKSSLEDFERAYHESDLDALLVEIKHYFENRTYNQAIVERIKEQLGSDEAATFDIIFSAHGLPQKIVDKGDPYQRHVERHVELLKTMLSDDGLDFNKVHLAYQSKVGPMQWLEPALDDTLRSLENRNVLIYPIAFTVDNSETDFELGVEYKEVADELEFENYRVCRCVNDHKLFVDALAELYRKMQ